MSWADDNESEINEAFAEEANKMSEQKKPREIIAERVDVYCKRHNVKVEASPNESFVLITDGNESVFVGEKKTFVEKSFSDAQALEIEKLKLENKEMRFELEAKQRPLGEQVLELTIERDRLQAENEKLKERLGKSFSAYSDKPGRYANAKLESESGE